MLTRPIRSPIRSAISSVFDRRAAGGGGAPAFDPATLFASGEQGAWYDPSDFTTMFQDIAGTIPVTAVGQVVGRINDKSGRGNHATQETTAAKPVLQQDAGGKYYIYFDGIDDGLSTASTNFTGTNKINIFSGLYFSNASGFDGVIEVVGNTTPGSLWVYGNGASIEAKARGASSTSNGLFLGAVIGATPLVYSFSFDLAGASVASCVSIRRNEVAISNTGTNLAGGGNYGAGIITVGYSVGTRLTGRVYSLIVRGAETDAAGITNSEIFVNSKTGAY